MAIVAPRPFACRQRRGSGTSIGRRAASRVGAGLAGAPDPARCRFPGRRADRYPGAPRRRLACPAARPEGRVENIASNEDAAAAVAHAPADGYTLLVIGPANAMNATLPKRGDVDFRRDFLPVAGVTREALAMVVHPSVPARDVEDFLNYARAHPGVKMAVTNPGTAPQVAGELFRTMTGLDLAAVPFAGGPPALRAVIAGDAAVMFEPMSAAVEAIRDGKVRALAVTTAERTAALPDVAPMAETLLDFEVSAVTGIAAPRATPAALVERLNREIVAAYADEAMKARFTATGGEVLPASAAEFGKLFGLEIANWGRLLRLSGVVPR